MSGPAAQPRTSGDALAEPPRRYRWRRFMNVLSSALAARRTFLNLTLLSIAWTIFAFGGVYSWAYTPAYWLLDAALLLWAIQYARGRLRLRRDELWIPILALLAWIVAQWLWVSPIPGRTLTSLLHALAAAAVFFLIGQNYHAPRDQAWMLHRLSWLCGTLGWLSFVEWASGSRGIYWYFHFLLAQPFGPFVDRDNFAACMALLLPASMLQVWRSRRQMDYALLWAAIPLIGIADVILSRSLSGMLVVALELGCMAWVLGSRHGKSESHRARSAGLPRRTRLRRSSLQWALAMLLLLAAVASFSGLGAFTARLHRLSAQISTRQRLDLDRSTLALWRQHPWQGWGLGTWQPVYYRDAHLKTQAVFEYAHNDWLQWLCETGLIGSLIAILGLGLFARRFLAEASHHRPDADLSWAAMVGLGGLAVNTLAQFDLHIPSILLLAGLIAALAAPVSQLSWENQGIH